jgi:hypothetical protein
MIKMNTQAGEVNIYKAPDGKLRIELIDPSEPEEVMAGLAVDPEVLGANLLSGTIPEVARAPVLKADARERIVSLLYTLMRDLLPAGVMEQQVRDIERCPGPYQFSNEQLRDYARQLTVRIVDAGGKGARVPGPFKLGAHSRTST